MACIFRRLFAALCMLLAVTPALAQPAHTTHHFAVANGHFLLDGQPFQIISGDMDYVRTPRAYWLDPGYGKGVRFGLSDRHAQGTNIVFADGHAKWYRTDSLLSQKAIDSPSPGYIEMTNYNAAGVIWDVDAPNPYTAPNKWPTTCCK